MTPTQALLVAVAGFGAGAINAVVGSGTLITFPVLLAVGLPPVTANVSNTVGLVPGSLAGALGYRRELAGQRPRLVRLGALAVAGALAGGVLLLTLPAAAFGSIVPVLIVLACVLVVIQPRVSAALRTRSQVTSGSSGTPSPRHRPAGGPLLQAGIVGSGMYGGYFGAAQGVLLIGLMGLLLDEQLQRVNAAKNVLALLVNATAALLFIAVADIAWDAVGLVAAGSIAGGLAGSRVGRRLPDRPLRALVVVVGVVAIWRILAAT